MFERSVVLPVMVLLLVAAVPADDAMRTLFDARATAPGDWDCDKGVSVTLGETGAQLALAGTTSASAAPRQRVAYDPEAVVTLQFQDVRGSVLVQAEWIGDAGKFLGATEVLSGAEVARGLSSRKLSEFLPHDRTAVARCRLKIWLGGERAAATVTRFTIDAPRRWGTPGVRTVRTYDGRSRIECDTGIKVVDADGALWAVVETGTPYSAFVLPERTAYQPGLVVLLDLLGQGPSGSVSVQALCWDRDGNALASVDVMRDVLEPGVYEVPLALYADQIPPSTAQISFKLWVGGPEAKARIGALLVGQTESKP